MVRLERFEGAAELRRAQRRQALEPLKAALKREGRSIAWLGRQIEERVRLSVKASSLRAYLNGYARIPVAVFSAACWIAGVREADILTWIDEEVLLQPKRSKKRTSASA